jgi:hypothetical protein
LNTVIQQITENQEPKIKHVDAEEQNLYKSGLLLLSTFIKEDFLDLPLLPENIRTNPTDGLFYNLPFYHDETLYQNGRSQDLLVVYQIQEGVLECPLRIEFELLNKSPVNYVIRIFDQSGERTAKYNLVERRNGTNYSNYKELLDMTLSEIVAHFA